MSRLGLGLGITKGGLIPFNPLSLDPYLFFDSRSSMIGTLENPTLDLDPANPETLDVITASRAGVATYTDADGLIQSASPNTTRVDYVQGEQLTPTVYQRVGYTDFSSGWNNLNSTSEAGDGYLGQPSLIVNAPVLNARTTTSAPTETGVSYTASFYVRYVNGSGLVWMYTQFASDNQFTPITVTSEWTRVQVQFTGGSGSSVNFGVSPKVVGESVEISQPQVEEGTTASSFVANTTGSPKFITGATYGPRVPMILVEPSSVNLVTYSEDFSQSSWDKQSGGTGVAPAITSDDTTAPDGTQSADKVVFNKGASADPANYSILSDAFPSQQNTASLFIKADSPQRIVIRNSSNWVAYDVTTEWTRIEQTDNGGSLQIGLRDGYGIPNVPDTATVYLWGAQAETGSVATSYIPTSGSTVTRAADDLQIERDSTNLVPYSEDFSQWSTKSGATLTANYGISPDGTQNSTRLQFSGASNQLADNITTSSSSTGSVWVKGTSGETIRFGVYASEANFTLNGSWQRIQKQGTATSNILTINTYGGATARDLEIWGGQLEDGSEATSYIPTSGAAASRTTFSDFYNQSEGTFYMESTGRGYFDYNTSFAFSDNSSANRIYARSTSNSGGLTVFSGGSVSASMGGLTVVANNVLSRSAHSFKANNFLTSRDGNSATPDTNGNMPAGIDRLYIGASQIGGNQLNGHIKRLIYWPYHSDSL